MVRHFFWMIAYWSHQTAGCPWYNLSGNWGNCHDKFDRARAFFAEGVFKPLDRWFFVPGGPWLLGRRFHFSPFPAHFPSQFPPRIISKLLLPFVRHSFFDRRSFNEGGSDGGTALSPIARNVENYLLTVRILNAKFVSKSNPKLHLVLFVSN